MRKNKKSKTGRYCFCFLLLGILLIGMSGCGKAEPKESAKEVSEEIAMKRLETYSFPEVEYPEETNLAGLLQEYAAGCVVQIRAGNHLGSGVILQGSEEKIVILTAAHVLEAAEEVEVSFGTWKKEQKTKEPQNKECSVKSSTHRMEWRIVADCDLGVLEMGADSLPEIVWEDCLAARIEKERFDALKAGDSILVLGSTDGVGENAYEGVLQESWIYLKDYEQYMMLATTYAQPGMSGGGVFDRYGCLVGILSGADEAGNLAIVPLSFVLREISGL